MGGRGRRAVLVGAVPAVVFAALVGGAGPAAACSCPEPPPPDEARDGADAVFAGEVVGSTEHDEEPPGPWLHARVEVSEVWKGEVHEVVAVRTHVDEATCGYGFEGGREELVYASVDDEGRFTTHLCARTVQLDRAGEDLAALGSGQPPVPGDQPGLDPDTGLPLSVIVAAGALLGAALAAVLLRRRA